MLVGFFSILKVMLMTHDETWLAMIEALYGKEYVEKLLEKKNEEEEEFDGKRQNENSEWSLD